MKIRRIVVGLELGKLSDQAIQRAMSLAREFEARLDVVHGSGVETPSLGPSRRAFMAEFAERARASARAAARGKLELLVEDPSYAGMPLDDYLHIQDGDGAQALLDFAHANAADLIVLGAHRHRALLDFGGTGRAVLAASPCPVWVEPAEARRFERVLAPIDLSPATALVLAAARSLAARFSVPVRVLHVFLPPEFAFPPGGPGPGPGILVERLRDEERAAARALVTAFDWGALPVETEFTDGEPAREIVAHAGTSDLIVMGTHGHRGLSRAVLGSCAYRVLKHAQVPILVIPQRAGAAAG